MPIAIDPTGQEPPFETLPVKEAHKSRAFVQREILRRRK